MKKKPTPIIMPFRDVPIGAKLRFHNHILKHVREIIYTRVEPPPGERFRGQTLTYVDPENSITTAAYVAAHCDTLVEVLEVQK